MVHKCLKKILVVYLCCTRFIMSVTYTVLFGFSKLESLVAKVLEIFIDAA